MDPKKELSEDAAIKKAFGALVTSARMSFDPKQFVFVLELMCGEESVDSFSDREPQKVVAWLVKNYPNAEIDDGWANRKDLANISERRRRNILKMHRSMKNTRDRRARAREAGLKRKAELAAAKERGHCMELAKERLQGSPTQSEAPGSLQPGDNTYGVMGFGLFGLEAS